GAEEPHGVAEAGKVAGEGDAPGAAAENREAFGHLQPISPVRPPRIARQLAGAEYLTPFPPGLPASGQIPRRVYHFAVDSRTEGLTRTHHGSAPASLPVRRFRTVVRPGTDRPRPARRSAPARRRRPSPQPRLVEGLPRRRSRHHRRPL